MIQCPHCRGSGTLSRSWSGGIEAYPCFYCAKPADTIPRATLVSALRERADVWQKRALAALNLPRASAEERLMDHRVRLVQRVECLTLADEIERGEWPRREG